MIENSRDFEMGTDEKKLRVAFVSPIGSIAGGERVLMELARGLQKSGHEAKVFCLREGSWTRGTWGTDVEVVAPRKGYRIRYPWTVLRSSRWLKHQLLGYKPTIIHANHASWWIAAWASRNMDASTIWHLYDYPDHKDFPTRVGVRFPPSATLFTSHHVASAYPELTNGRHAIIPPVTVESSEFRSAERDESILSTHNLEGSRFVVTVCRWQPHKGLHDLVAAASILIENASELKDLQFVVVGKPSNSSEEAYRESVCEKIDSSRLENVFHFVEDCDDRQLRSLYANAIALVHPALSEGFGLVLLEAMSLGTPVIACDASGPAEVLAGGRGGILVPRGEPEKLSEAISKVVSDLRQHQAMSEAGLLRAAELSRDRMVEQTLELYESVMLPRRAKI